MLTLASISLPVVGSSSRSALLEFVSLTQDTKMSDKELSSIGIRNDFNLNVHNVCEGCILLCALKALISPSLSCPGISVQPKLHALNALWKIFERAPLMGEIILSLGCTTLCENKKFYFGERCAEQRRTLQCSAFENFESLN